MKSFGNDLNKIPLIYQAWAIAIAETVLNPKYNHISVNEDVIRPVIDKFLVSMSTFNFYFKIFRNFTDKIIKLEKN